jgi:hypothetical protein
VQEILADGEVRRVKGEGLGEEDKNFAKNAQRPPAQNVNF